MGPLVPKKYFEGFAKETSDGGSFLWSRVHCPICYHLHDLVTPPANHNINNDSMFSLTAMTS